MTTWKQLLNDTNQLKKPNSAKQLVSKNDIEELQPLLIDVLNGFLAKEDIHIGLKIYINHQLRNDYIEKLVTNPPRKGTPLEDWSKEIFGDQKFGMILIGLEQYSNAFAEKAATIVKPLLENAGMPLNGLSFLFFMGNYGFTPFGIHKEATGEEGILFHLGPGTKQFYTWDDPKYNNIEHNTEVFHNVLDMIPDAEEYELQPGDAMFIPHYVYHIANTSEFSSSFVLDYINPPKDSFENQLLAETAGDALVHHTTYQKPIQLNAPKDALTHILDFDSIQQKLQTSFNRKMQRLQSNGGIKRKSRSINTFIPQSENYVLKGKKIFPLYLEQQDANQVLIFARGHQITKRNHPNLPDLIARFNNEETFTLTQLRTILEPTWDLIDVFGFIQDLLKTEAVVVDLIPENV